MRVALDMTPSITGATGIARYVEGLTQALAQRGDVEVAPFAVGRGAYPVPPGVRHFPAPLRVVGQSWRHGGPPTVERLVGRVDSTHASGPVLPSSRSPVVAVVFDVAALDHPYLHPQRDVRQLEAYLRALPRAHAVITISQATADALAGRGVPRDLLHVIPLGTTELPAPRDPGWARPYVLAVGAPVPRKAYDDLLRAVALLDDDDLAVVIVGPEGTEDAALGRLAVELGIGDRYHRAGPVDDAHLAGWYQSASALAAPSVEEGFGLPILEAQRAGTPVVASDIAAHREVADGGAALVPVGAVPTLAEALEAAVAGGPSVARAVQRGRENAARYTWAACAEATIAVHRSVSTG